jgi:hypothetical protein
MTDGLLTAKDGGTWLFDPPADRPCGGITLLIYNMGNCEH